MSSSQAPTSTSSKKPTSKKPASKGKATPKAKVRLDTTTSRPSWKDIIKECIVVNKEDVRQGVSRNTIKRYVEETYKIDMSGVNLSQLNRAITSGTESGIFVLPKGPSGKIKLAPRKKPLTSASKENSKPPSKLVALTKPASTKKAAVKKTEAAAPKKVLAGKAKSKSSTTTKKATAPSKRGATKKAVTVSKKAAATKKGSVKKTVSAKRLVTNMLTM